MNIYNSFITFTVIALIVFPLFLKALLLVPAPKANEDEELDGR